MLSITTTTIFEIESLPGVSPEEVTDMQEGLSESAEIEISPMIREAPPAWGEQNVSCLAKFGHVTSGLVVSSQVPQWGKRYNQLE